VIEVAVVSHTGKVRARNEDCFVIAGVTCAGHMLRAISVDTISSGPAPTLFAVVDGLGGHAAGETASWLAAREMCSAAPTGTATADSITTMLMAANTRLFTEMELSPRLVFMGATVAGVCFQGDNVFFFNVGDARAYEHVGRDLKLRTEDDRLWQRDGGVAGGVTQCLGGAEHPVRIAPHVKESQVLRPTRFLLCTDGLSDFVSFDVIQKAMGGKSPGRAADVLLEAFIGSDASDNMTAIVLDFSPERDRGRTEAQ
jgi:serine/threonine protein phosphatase PrpC